MKSILAIVLAFFAATAATAAPVPAANQTAIRAFLNKLYATYRTNDTAHARKGWGEVIGFSNIFTVSTNRLWSENVRLSAGENTGLDFDFFCACQDYDKSLRLISVTMTPLAKGRVNAKVQIFNYGAKSISIQFEKTPAGWRVYDVELPRRQGMLRAVLIKENAELSKSATAVPASSIPSPPAFPESIEYVGNTGSDRFPVFNDFKITQRAGALGGSAFMMIGIFSGEVPITGTYANGECAIFRKKQTYRGLCDAAGFSGTIYSASGKPGEAFRFLSMTELDRLKAGGSPATASYGAPPTTAAYEAPAEAVLVPSYGRTRLLVEPGGRCSDIGQLVKGYCFDTVIGYLRQHPDLNDVTVVTMTRSYVLGTWVPHNSGQGWNVYEVKRRGDGFYADRDRQFSTKVNPPQGCAPATLNDEGWLVATSQGYKVAAEAKHFLCDPARSSPSIVSQGARSLPLGGGSPAGGRGSSSYVSPAAAAGSSRSYSSQASGRTNLPDDRERYSTLSAYRDDSGLIYGSPDDTPAPRARKGGKRRK